MLIFQFVVRESVDGRIQYEIKITTSTYNRTWLRRIIISFNQTTLGMVVGGIWNGTSVLLGSYRSVLFTGYKRDPALGLD